MARRRGECRRSNGELAVITLETVTYTYPATEGPALSDVSFEIEKGSLLAVVGANAAGKSTLCYTLSGFVPHFYHGTLSGRVTVAGRDIAESSLSELAGEIGLVFQDPFNQITGARFTLREEVAFGLENLGVAREEMEERVAAALDRVGLGGLGDRSPYAISGGQQQRLAIASVLVMEPAVLILDEPTSQLDPAGTRELFSILAELAADRKTTVVIAGHKIEWIASFADRVLVLNDGRLVDDGPPRSILSANRPGVGRTRYTRVAEEAVARGLGSGELPVTLDQAVEFFT